MKKTVGKAKQARKKAGTGKKQKGEECCSEDCTCGCCKPGERCECCE